MKSVPHLLVYAKIRGFPYWPAKVLKINGTELDVRFFGAHDRSTVGVDKCYWLSEEFPSNVRNHIQLNMQQSVKELNMHIEQLRNKYGDFKYAEPMTLIDLANPHVFIDKFSGKFVLAFVKSYSGLFLILLVWNTKNNI